MPYVFLFTDLTPIIVAETATLARTAFYLSMIGVNLSLGGVLGLCTAFLVSKLYLYPITPQINPWGYFLENLTLECS